MTLWRPALLLSASMAVIALPRSVAAQQRPAVATLDTLVRRYWRAGIANDSLEMKRVTSGDQPRRVMPLFTSSAHSMPTATEASRARVRRQPATQFRGDTAWRAYSIQLGQSTAPLPYMVRFERRCAAWKIVSVSMDAAAGYPAQPPNDR